MRKELEGNNFNGSPEDCWSVMSAFLIRVVDTVATLTIKFAVLSAFERKEVAKTNVDVFLYEEFLGHEFSSLP